MAIRPDILLTQRPIDQSQVVQGFQNALLSLAGRDPVSLERQRAELQNQLLAEQVGQASEQLSQEQELGRIRSIALFSDDIEGDVRAGNLGEIRRKTVERIRKLPARGIDPSDSMEFLNDVIDNPQLTDDQKLNATRQLSEQAKAAAIAFGAIQPSKLASLEKTTTQRDFDTFKSLKGEEKAQFGRAKGFLPRQTEGAGKLSAGLEKRLFESQDAAINAGKEAREAELLAGDFDRVRLAGATSSINELFKRFAGSQDEATELRRRFNKIRLGQALKFLPPGPATDKDVSEAFKGVPDENASPEQVQSFLRGSAKMAKLNEEFESFKANYISERLTATGMLKAWQEKVKNGDVAALDAFQPVDQQPEEAPGVVRIRFDEQGNIIQ